MAEEEFAKLVARLRQLRVLGVKTASFATTAFGPELSSVEFFPRSEHQAITDEFGKLDLDTLVPPAPQHAAPAEEEDPPPLQVPPALARLLKNGSVS